MKLSARYEKRIAAALAPSGESRLMENASGTGYWPMNTTMITGLTKRTRTDWIVLDAVLVRNAFASSVLLTLVNEPEEEIEAAGVITDCFGASRGTEPPLV